MGGIRTSKALLSESIKQGDILINFIYLRTVALFPPPQGEENTCNQEAKEDLFKNQKADWLNNAGQKLLGVSAIYMIAGAIEE